MTLSDEEIEEAKKELRALGMTEKAIERTIKAYKENTA